MRSWIIAALLLASLGSIAAGAADQPGQRPLQDEASPGDAPPKSNRNETGVLRPPPTGDEDAVKPAPQASKDPMPVITPPGAPGGNQNVQPK
jgi:hypothetical protein